MKPAGIIASMQPTHQTSDRTMAEARLGPARLDGAYAWQTIGKMGVPLAFGCGLSGRKPQPLPRPHRGGQSAGSEWPAAGRMAARGARVIATALNGFTRDAAYAGFAETGSGSLEPGKWADFIFVDRDLAAVDPQALAATRVLETWVAGNEFSSAAATRAD